MPDRSVSEHGTLAEAARKHPQAIVCLLSALQVHDLTTQLPFEVWLAIPNKARAPKMDYPPLRIVRFSGTALTDGIEEHPIDGVTVRVTNVARTVADCFKFRNKIGLDVAMEALREAWRARRVSMDELALCHAVPRGRCDAPLHGKPVMNQRNTAASVRARLLTRARETRQDFNRVLTRYALELAAVPAQRLAPCRPVPAERRAAVRLVIRHPAPADAGCGLSEFWFGRVAAPGGRFQGRLRDGD